MRHSIYNIKDKSKQRGKRCRLQRERIRNMHWKYMIYKEINSALTLNNEYNVQVSHQKEYKNRSKYFNNRTLKKT